MTTRSLVDPELAGLLDTFPALHLTREVLPQIRAAFEETMKTQPRVDPPAFAMISVRKRSIPGPQGAPDVPVLLYQPTHVGVPKPVLLWIHGGGYVLGSADQEDHKVKSIVAAVGCAVISVDYRLAPETP